MKDCLFCKIGEGSLPSFKIWEDEFAVAFLDLFPMGSGHTLIIPKIHSDNYLSLSPELWGHMGALAGRIAGAHMGEGAEGTNFFMTQGAVAGQTVFHTHWHILPRWAEDKVQLGKSQGRASDAELKDWQIRLSARLGFKL